MKNLDLGILQTFPTNVIPTTEKNVASSRASDFVFPSFFDPASIALHKVSGCYNSVIQISSGLCLRIFHSSWNPGPLKFKISKSRYDQFMSIIGNVVTLEQRQLLQSFIQVALGNGIEIDVGIEIDFLPVGLQFFTPNSVSIAYRLDFWLVVKPVSVIPSTQNSFSDYQHGGSTLPPKIRVGSADLTIDAEYFKSVEPTLKMVNIIVGLDSAQIKVLYKDKNSADLMAALGVALQSTVQNTYSQKSIFLAPTLSLFGTNPNNSPINEITRFDVDVFHIDANMENYTSDINTPLQALVAAFTVMPGSHGFHEDIVHFIGTNDYGVISDEYLIANILKNKWNMGGFDRQLPINAPVAVEMSDGSTDNATLYCILNLNTLDSETIETNSDTRTDYIRLQGMASLVPQYLTLSDGTILGPNDVDLGTPQENPWAALTSIVIDGNLSDNAELREFQIRASEDGYTHLIRPFALHPKNLSEGELIRIDYLRLEAVSKLLFALGHFLVTYQTIKK
jgi:hypothetical protein